MYAYGAASVKCAVCQTVTPVNPSTTTHSPYPGPSSSDANAAEHTQKSQQTVVIVNPPTLDADGNEVGHKMLQSVVPLAHTVQLQAFSQSSRPLRKCVLYSMFSEWMLHRTSTATVVLMPCAYMSARAFQVEDYVVGVTSDPAQPSNSHTSSRNTSQAASSHS